MQHSSTATPCTIHRLGLVEYEEGQTVQHRFVKACKDDGQARLILLEHPPTYTLGARGETKHLLLSEAALAERGASVQRTDRGGDVTFHGPGQLVAYPIFDLSRWNQGPRWYVRSLEQVLLDTLADFSVEATRVEGRQGAWVGDAKIAAIGVRVSRGVTSHGFALNVDPDLSYYAHIVPCGIADATVTSMADQLGGAPPMPDVIDAVVLAFSRVFSLDVQETLVAEAIA